MRKLMAALVAFCFTVGLAVAAEVTFVKYDDATKTLTVKEGDKETSYKIGDKVKGEMFGKAKEGKTKLDITVDGGTVTKVVPIKKK